MALMTFQPTQGPHAGVAWTLPPIQDQLKTAAHIDRMADAFAELQEMNGVYLGSGAQPMYLAYGEIQAVFEISQGWLVQQGYVASYGGMMTALYDFSQAVLGGGLGTFTEPLPSGALAGLGGASVTSRSCQAIVHGDYNPVYEAGAPICTLSVTFMVPGCQWLYSNGVLIPFI